jgi:hypothetical protein
MDFHLRKAIRRILAVVWAFARGARQHADRLPEVNQLTVCRRPFRVPAAGTENGPGSGTGVSRQLP